eukprot:jgi/Hompol1/5537/HPOL_002008-RA
MDWGMQSMPPAIANVMQRGKLGFGVVSGYYLGVYRYAKNPAAALKFIDYVSSQSYEKLHMLEDPGDAIGDYIVHSALYSGKFLLAIFHGSSDIQTALDALDTKMYQILGWTRGANGTDVDQLPPPVIARPGPKHIKDLGVQVVGLFATMGATVGLVLGLRWWKLKLAEEEEKRKRMVVEGDGFMDDAQGQTNADRVLVDEKGREKHLHVRLVTDESVFVAPVSEFAIDVAQTHAKSGLSLGAGMPRDNSNLEFNEVAFDDHSESTRLIS